MNAMSAAFLSVARWSSAIACFIAGIIAATLLVALSVMAMHFRAHYADPLSAWISIPIAFSGLFAPCLWFVFSLTMLIWLGDRLRYRLQFCGWMLGMTIAAAISIALLYGSTISAMFMGAAVSLAMLFLKRSEVTTYVARCCSRHT